MGDLFHSILGLPSSGKTTYLAALWHLIDAGEVETKLVLDKLVGDHSYLNAIVDAWRRCEEVPRTSLAAEEQSLSIHVHERQTGKNSVLAFPDLSGESFDRQFGDRLCSEEYIRGFDGEGGIALFVNADRASDGMTLLDLAPAVVPAEEPGRPNSVIPAEGSKAAAAMQVKQADPWSPKQVPEQVKLVELLQFLQRRPFHRCLRRLAVIVSAWDVVIPPSLNPSEWVSREMPLLNQFLKNNLESFEVRVYGVSAQGGSVKGAGRNELLKVLQPSLRIRCVGPNTLPHDLTSPLAWLNGGD